MNICLLRIALLICFILNCNFSWAKSSISNKLRSEEIKVFGKTTDKNLPIKTRIAKLEQTVFGKTKTGTISQRLAAIDQALTNKNFKKTISQDAKTNTDITAKNISKNNSPAKSVSLCDIHLIRENPILASTTPDPNASKTNDNTLSSTADNSNSDKNQAITTDSSLSSLASANAPSSSANSLDKDKSQDTHLLKLGMKLYQEGKLSQAKACFKEVLFNNPNSYNAYFNLGVIAESRSDWNSALNDYQNALAIDPHNTEIKTAVQQLQSRIASNNKINNNKSPSNFISTDSILNQMASNNYQNVQPDYANANLPKYTPPKKFKETFWDKHPVLKKIGVRTLEVGGLALIVSLPFLGLI